MAARGNISKDWLNAKFGNIEAKLDEHASILREHLAQDRIDFDSIGEKLDGHNLRVDRLEQAKAGDEKKQKFMRSFGPSILGALTGAIFGWFAK